MMTVPVIPASTGPVRMELMSTNVYANLDTQVCSCTCINTHMQMCFIHKS